MGWLRDDIWAMDDGPGDPVETPEEREQKALDIEKWQAESAAFRVEMDAKEASLPNAVDVFGRENAQRVLTLTQNEWFHGYFDDEGRENFEKETGLPFPTDLNLFQWGGLKSIYD